MHRHLAELDNSTIVRFFMVILPVFLVTGCGSIAALGSGSHVPRSAGTAVCESFGPETRCSDTDSLRIARELDRFNQSARLGFRGW